MFSHGENYIDPQIELTRHQIRAAEPHLLLATVTEIIDAGMLQEASNDRGDRDGLTEAWNTRAQTADAAHLKVDFHPGLCSSVERLDTGFVDQGVHLQRQVAI